MKELHGEGKIYLWLDSFNLERQEKNKLLKSAGSAKRLLSDLDEVFNGVFKGEHSSVLNAMRASLCDGGEYFRRFVDKLSERGLEPIPYPDERYPNALKTLANPPLVLYAKGNLSLLTDDLFCIVGSRKTGATTMKTTAKIAQTLSERLTILTGVADGGDYASIEGALKGTKKIVCLAAGGYDAVPKTNDLLPQVQKYGLLLTAHPYFTPVRSFSYGERNELLSALASGALVVSAGEKSGALITANYIKKQNKPLFALPYPPESYTGAGCNALIKEGAYLTETAEDIFQKLGVQAPEKTTNELPLTDNERKAYELLQTETELPVSIIAQKTGLPPYLIGGVIASLEIKGLVVRTGGGRVCLVR